MFRQKAREAIEQLARDQRLSAAQARLDATLPFLNEGDVVLPRRIADAEYEVFFGRSESSLVHRRYLETLFLCLWSSCL